MVQGEWCEKTKNAKQVEQVEQEMMKKWRIPITQNHNLAWKRGNVPDAQLNWEGGNKVLFAYCFFCIYVSMTFLIYISCTQHC